MPDRNPIQTDLLPPAGSARVRVMLTLPFAGPLDYTLPPRLAGAMPGILLPCRWAAARKRGDMGRHNPPAAGIHAAPTKDVPTSRLKPVAARLDLPPLPAQLRRFVDWVAAYTSRRRAWCWPWRCGPMHSHRCPDRPRAGSPPPPCRPGCA
ncbi:hypothetical protein RAA17_06525 [Komagataeibacter rhaeticus]|nr:hypothetical protein [Komagataeibacter rhaeticus]